MYIRQWTEHTCTVVLVSVRDKNCLGVSLHSRKDLCEKIRFKRRKSFQDPPHSSNVADLMDKLNDKLPVFFFHWDLKNGHQQHRLLVFGWVLHKWKRMSVMLKHLRKTMKEECFKGIDLLQNPFFFIIGPTDLKFYTRM